MTIGEKICELRKANGLSQSELAEKLEVSRQSISKWETDSAVPELDKLMRLCDIFDVSLDELTGRQVKKDEETVPHHGKSNERPLRVSDTGTTQQKIIGYILLGFSLLAFLVFFLMSADWLVPLLVSLPVLICSIICLSVKKNAGYWCGWTAYGLMEMLPGFLIGIGLRSPLYIGFRLLSAAGLAWAAWRCFKNDPIKRTAGNRKRLAAAWIGFIVLATAASAAGYAFGGIAVEGIVAFLIISEALAVTARGFLYRQTARYMAGGK